MYTVVLTLNHLGMRLAVQSVCGNDVTSRRSPGKRRQIDQWPSTLAAYTASVDLSEVWRGFGAAFCHARSWNI